MYILNECDPSRWKGSEDVMCALGELHPVATGSGRPWRSPQMRALAARNIRNTSTHIYTSFLLFKY
jgi:hypothetical protein